VELVRNALRRLDETEPRLNAFVHRDDEGAMAAARAADKMLARGGDMPPLLGIPASVKDLIEVQGMPCSYGSLTMTGYVAASDSPSVARVRRAGAIIIGKTSTSEFGYRGYTASQVHGVTRNCWNTDRTPGGSSGGAVTSVAAGVTPLALATDGGGSIRGPCSLTGLVGIKAQFGRVPVYPPSATSTLAHVGPVARNVLDCATLLRLIAGPDGRDWTSRQTAIASAGRATKPWNRLRVAFSPTLGYARVAPEVAAVVQEAVRALGGVKLIETVCDDPADILVTEFIGGCSARLGDAVERSPEKIDPPLLAAIEVFRRRSAADIMNVLRTRANFREHMHRFFEKVDVLLTPTTPCSAWPIGHGFPPGLEDARAWVFFTYPFNLTGQPAASIPCGWTQEGLPVGLQVVVKPGQEALLIGVLGFVEAQLRIQQRSPPI
jgi:Asp-tRNA(Asn)/Glu-tRNA(Gln) amidotransferase A subunit family amidase